MLAVLQHLMASSQSVPFGDDDASRGTDKRKQSVPFGADDARRGTDKKKQSVPFGADDASRGTDKWKQSDLEFVAIAPPQGPLAGRLKELGVPLRGLSMFDADGQRRHKESIEDDLRSAIKDLQPDLIHGNSLSMGRFLGRMTDTLPVPTTSHIRDIIGLSKAAVRDLNRNDRLIAVSAATRDYHVVQGVDPDRISVVHNGINADTFARNETVRRELRSELGIPPEAIVILTAGQIGLRKGLDTLVNAAVHLSETHRGLHWLLAGERFSTKTESIEFEQSIDQRFRSAEPRLTYHRLGWRTDMPRLMSAADILVHAARQEPLGRVLLEAAAAGLAIVATNVGGTSEIVTDDESARLIPPDTPDRMSDAIQAFVEASPLRQQFGLAARTRILTSFTIATAAEHLSRHWNPDA